MKDADEDEDTGCVAEKAGRRAWIKPDRQGNDHPSLLQGPLSRTFCTDS